MVIAQRISKNVNKQFTITKIAMLTWHDSGTNLFIILLIVFSHLPAFLYKFNKSFNNWVGIVI